MAAKKYLYFIKGTVPTSAEAAAITRFQALLKNGDSVFVRNASESDGGYSGHREACDGVAGAVPTLYTSGTPVPLADLSPSASPESFKVFPSTLSIAAADAPKPVYAISADLNETTGATALSDLSKDAKVAWSSADETKCTVDTDGIVTRVANGGPTDVTATYTSVAAVKASLDLAKIPRSKMDTVVQAVAAGPTGNAKKIAMVGDAEAKAGTSGYASSTLTLHFQPDVSTVGDMETLITAAAGTSGIEVKTGGTGATVLESITEDNVVTGDPIVLALPEFPAQSLEGGADAVTSTATCAVTTTA